MQNVLLVGQNPEEFQGNGNMMYICLKQIPKNVFNICTFLQGNFQIDTMSDPFSIYFPRYPIIKASDENQQDNWGNQRLIHLIEKIKKLDQLIFVGIDIWRYLRCFEAIKELQKIKKFTWKVIVPYDLDHIRNDWIDWLNIPDMTFVYSRYSYNVLKKYVKNLYYFRPFPRYFKVFNNIKNENKQKIREIVFNSIPKESIIFGFIGNNQLRKNIINTIRGFKQALEIDNRLILYIHTDTLDGAINIRQTTKDCKIPKGALLHMDNNIKLSPEQMAVLIKSFDFHVLPSMQEGLSWTVVEAKLAGVPSLISATTAHYDFAGIPSTIFINPDHTTYLPLMTESGPTYVKNKTCSAEVIRDGFLECAKIFDSERMEVLKKDAFEFGRNWCTGCHDFSYVLFNTLHNNNEKELEKQIIGEEI